MTMHGAVQYRGYTIHHDGTEFVAEPDCPDGSVTEIGAATLDQITSMIDELWAPIERATTLDEIGPPPAWFQRHLESGTCQRIYRAAPRANAPTIASILKSIRGAGAVAAAVVAAVAASATLGARLDVDGDGFITQHDLVAFAQESHWGPHSAPIEMKRKIQINNTVYQATFARSTQDPSVLEAVSFEEVASHGLAAHAVTQESAKISSLN